VVIGGIGRMEGPFLGTILFFILREFFADLGSWYLMFLGLFAIVMMLIMPKGIAGWLAERFNLEIFPLGRRIILPKDKPMSFSQFRAPATSNKRSPTKVNDD
jgi:branched-chain amino acid transport system permease protein